MAERPAFFHRPDVKEESEHDGTSSLWPMGKGARTGHQAVVSHIFMRNADKRKAAEREPCCYLASKQASWRRNRRESDSLSPLRWVPQSVLLVSTVEIVSPKHPHVNPPPPPFKVPRTEWPRVVQRVAQGESLRQVARSYRVSYEAIRRILAAARRPHAQVEEGPWE